MRAIIRFGLGAVVATALLWVAQGQAQKAPIIIGAAPNMTGIQAALGKAQLAGLEMAVDQINKDGGIGGHELKVLSTDSGDSPTTALNAYNKMVDSGAKVVMGPILGGQVDALIDATIKTKVPLFTGSTSTALPQGSPFVFRWMPNDSFTKRAWVLFARDQLKVTKIGMLHVSATYGRSGQRFTEAAAKELGMTLVGVESYAPGDKDMSVQLRKLRDAGADAILVQGFAPDQTLVLQFAHRLGITKPIVISMSTIAAGAFDLVKPDEIQNHFSEAASAPQFQQPAETAKFDADFRRRTGNRPDHIAFGQYAATMLLAAAYREAGPTASSDALAAAIRKAKFTGQGYDLAADAQGNLAHSVLFVEFGANKTPKKTYSVKE
jgi:branched-chain amino acid transport system substrate-binding protein